MSEMTEGPLDTAWRPAGRFMCQFARVEAALNNVVKRVLDLEDNKGEYIVAQFDLARRVRLAIHAIEAEAKRHIPAWVEDATRTINELHKINNHRKLFAHQPFQPDGVSGIAFPWKAHARNRRSISCRSWS